MKIFKIIFFLPLSIIRFFIKGFKVLSLFLSRGFYFYFEKLFSFIEKIIPLKNLHSVTEYFHRRKEQPSHIVMMIVWFLCLLYLFDTLHVDNTNYVQSIFNDEINPKQVEKNDNDNKDESLLLNKEMNLYRIYGKYQLNDIHFDDLKNTNSDTVAWISVENTNVNYPVVQTSDNDYYLNHGFDKAYSTGGWTFMDYRNDIKMGDKNTIFYGHNLLNRTAFGSLNRIFSSKKANSKIIIMTDDGKIYTYQIFSAYIIDPEVYYLQTNFYSDSEYQTFLDTLVSRNILSGSNSVSIEDSIITLSTCTDDNKGRKVIHAKLIQVQ